MQLQHLSTSELLIAAGLCAGTKLRNECFYYSWVCYAKEIKRRKLTWKDARAAAQKMQKRTAYPRRGWEAKYVKAYGNPAVANVRHEPDGGKTAPKAL